MQTHLSRQKNKRKAWSPEMIKKHKCSSVRRHEPVSPQDSGSARRPRTCLLMGLHRLSKQSQGPMLSKQLDQGTLHEAATTKRGYPQGVDWKSPHPQRVQAESFVVSALALWNGGKILPIENSTTSTLSCRFGVRIHITCLHWNRPHETECEVSLRGSTSRWSAVTSANPLEKWLLVKPSRIPTNRELRNLSS